MADLNSCCSVTRNLNSERKYTDTQTQTQTQTQTDRQTDRHTHTHTHTHTQGTKIIQAPSVINYLSL